MTKLSPKQIWKGSVAWMVQNSVAANLLMIFLILGGLISMSLIKQEVFPEFELDMVTISIAYPGASPDEVERGIVLAVEQAVRSVDGVDEVTARVNTGSASITVTGIEGINRDRFLQEIQREVDAISTMPSEAEDPKITLRSTAHEVLTLVLTGSEDMGVLREWAEIIKDDLSAQPGITKVELDGLRDREIQVEIPAAQLRRYGLTISGVASTLASASLELGAGSMQTPNGDILIRVDSQRRYGEEFARIPILTESDGSQLYLEDVAQVNDGFADTRSWTEFNGQSTIMVEVYRVGDQSPQSVAAAAKDVITHYNAIMPGGLKLDILADDSKVYSQRMSLLLNNAALGIALVFICLALFLEIKLAFWVSLGIPTSILGSFLFLGPMGVSINMMSMFAFILTLGIVVDDAIVVGENIHIWRRRGLSRPEAAVMGTREITGPVIFSVLTNMVAFVPLCFLPGMAGNMFGVLPIVVNTVFACSLIESLYVLPAHLAHDNPPKAGTLLARISAWQRIFSAGFTHWIHRVYGPLLIKILRHRYLVLCACLALLIMCGAYLASGRLGFEMMPATESDMAFVEVSLPAGTSKEQLTAIKNRLELSAKQVVAENGGEALSTGFMASVRSTSVQGRLYLTDPDVRPLGTEAVTRLWRDATGPIPGAETVLFQSDRGGPGSGKAFTVRLIHKDITILEEAATALGEDLAKFANVRDIDTGMSRRTRQNDIRLLPLADQMGLTAKDVGAQVRSAFQGATALKMQRGADEVTVKVRLPEEERSQEGTFNELVLRTLKGQEVLLRDVAEIVEARPYMTINRNDGQRSLTVTADVIPKADAGQVVAAVNTEILPDLASRFPGLSWTYGGMQRDLNKSTSALAIGLILVLLAVYALLAVPFKSYTQPAIIMVSIPFGMVGAIIGHVLMGYKMSVISMAGVLALSGLVINDALVLIDFANRERREGMSATKAIHNAGIRRFRPVMLTTMTTFLGLAPMIFESSRQARQLIPVALSLGFGVIFATVITLALIPALYIILEDIHAFSASFSAKKNQALPQKNKAPAPEAEPSVGQARPHSGGNAPQNRA